MIQSGKGAEAAIEIIVAFSCTGPEGPHVLPRNARLSQRVARDDRRRGAFQRAGPLHRLHRLRGTSNTGGNNLHRNVIFRDNGDKASQVDPFTVYPPYGSDNPVELWKWMEAYERRLAAACWPSRTTAI